MSVYYNTSIPDISSVITAYNATPKCYPGNGTYKSLLNSSYDTSVSSMSISNNFASLNSSDPNEASIKNLSLNSYSQITAVIVVNCYSVTQSTKGAMFGYSEGSKYYNYTSIITQDPQSVLSTPGTSGVDSTITYTASSLATQDAQAIISTSGTSGVDSTITYTASSLATQDPQSVLSTPGTSGVDSTITYTTSSIIIPDISTNTTSITGTNYYADHPVNAILFKMDRSGEGVFARLKSEDVDLISTSSYYANQIKDVFAVVYERKPYNKLSIYLNGSLVASTTTASSINSFPSGGGMRLFANGVSTETFDGSMRTFLLYNKKLSDSEIFESKVI